MVRCKVVSSRRASKIDQSRQFETPFVAYLNVNKATDKTVEFVQHFSDGLNLSSSLGSRAGPTSSMAVYRKFIRMIRLYNNCSYMDAEVSLLG